MKKSKKQKCAFDLLPFHVIEAASTGDTEAIQAVLKHYEGYITVLATRKMFDEFGQVHYCVDETLRQRLETKLITKTLGFDTKSYVRKSNQYCIIGSRGTTEREKAVHKEYDNNMIELRNLKKERNAVLVAKQAYIDKNSDIIKAELDKRRLKELQESGLLDELDIE